MKRMIFLILAGLLAVCVGCEAAPREDPKAETFQQGGTFSENALPTYDVLLPTLPEGVDEGSLTLVQLPDRQQYVYGGTARLVLEVMEPGADETLAETEAATAGEKTVAAYVFGAGDIQYPGLSDAVLQGMACPNDGDQVLEWTENGRFYRLFGNVSRDALLAVAADVT